MFMTAVIERKNLKSKILVNSSLLNFCLNSILKGLRSTRCKKFTKKHSPTAMIDETLKNSAYSIPMCFCLNPNIEGAMVYKMKKIH